MAEPGAIRAGIVGGGFMATVHSRAIRAAGAQLHAVASSTPERARAAAAELGVRHAAESAEALIGDADVDVVHICTPNSTHERLVRLALAAGTHVVCEKPLAVSGAVAAELARSARERGVVATVPFVYRFHPMVREARARVAAGEIGRLVDVMGSYLQDWLLSADDQNWRVDPAAGGASRAFADIGSHLVDLVEFITDDRIDAVLAVTSAAHAERQGVPVTTEDLAHVLIRMVSGAHGSLVVSQVAAGHKNDLRVELFGTDASIGFEQERPDSITLGGRSHTAVISRDPATLSPEAARLSVVPAGHPMGYQDAFNAFVRDTYGQIRREPIAGVPGFADGARAARITSAVLDSAASGTWVSLSDTDRW